jgi:hypothetical protein
MSATSAKEYEERKLFAEKLTNLVKSEYEEIYRILKRANEPHSENTNGIFFNINEISADTFDKMKTFMDFCMENRSEQEQRIKALEALRSDAAVVTGGIETA